MHLLEVKVSGEVRNSSSLSTSDGAIIQGNSLSGGVKCILAALMSSKSHPNNKNSVFVSPEFHNPPSWTTSPQDLCTYNFVEFCRYRHLRTFQKSFKKIRNMIFQKEGGDLWISDRCSQGNVTLTANRLASGISLKSRRLSQILIRKLL